MLYSRISCDEFSVHYLIKEAQVNRFETAYKVMETEEKKKHNNTVFGWYGVELCTWNLYNFVNQHQLNKFNKKENKECITP